MPENKILIVIDMQKDFVDGSLGTKEAAAIVPNVIKKINDFDGKVIYTKDTHYEDYLETTEGKKLPVKHCIQGTKGHELQEDIHELCKKNQSAIYEKVTFGSSEMAKELQKEFKNSLEEIELIGLCTDICVISNALMLKAFFPETKIVVDASCCAGVTVETHKNALEAMKMCQIEVINEDVPD
jgi:nicotinamidase-related amidase